MIRRGTWVTLGIFAALLAFALVWERAGPEPDGGEGLTPTQAALWELAPDQIVRLRIEDRVAGQRLDLFRRADGTWLAADAGRVLDPGRVQRALDWLSGPRPRARVPEPADLTAYGLDEPTRRVTVWLADRTQVVLEIGAPVPTASAAYVLVDGQPDVLVVSTFGLDEVFGLLGLPTATPAVGGTPTGEPLGTPAPEAEVPTPAP
jgi:hypothetical protein